MNEFRNHGRARTIAAPLSLVLALAGAPAHAALTVTPVETGGSTRVSESGGRDSYTLALPQAPAVGEIVTITINPGAQLTATPQQVRFTDADFDQPRTITVGAINDATPEGPTPDEVIDHQLTSAGLPQQQHYAQATVGDVSVSVSDDDLQGVDFVETGADTKVWENGPGDAYSIVLTGQPTTNVKITLTTDRQRAGLAAQLTVTPPFVVFTPDNYRTPQTITLAAVDDFSREAEATETIRHGVESSDIAYNALSVRAVEAQIVDDDLASVQIAEPGDSTRVAEGGAGDSYTLRLTSRPTTSVTVTTHPENGQLTTSPPSVTFTSANWSQWQTIAVTAVDDLANEGGHRATITHEVGSSDSGYQLVPTRALTASITDNDAPGVLLGESNGETRVAEGGAEDSYTVVLTKRPSEDVIVTLNAGDPLVVRPSVVRFTAADYAVARTITVQAADDLVVEGERRSSIAHDVASGDWAYDQAPVDALSVAVADNDARGVQLLETGGATAVTEGGAADRYTLALTARPDADVEITVVSPDSGVRAQPDRLIFTPENFAQAQDVWVDGPDDAVAEAARLVTLTHAIASDDAAYRDVAIGTVLVSLSDDDSPGVSLTETDGTTAVAEGGVEDGYELVLRSQPLDAVTITIDAGDQLRAEPSSVTFTAADWNQPRVIRIAALDDAVVEGTTLATISHVATSGGDASYDAIAVPQVVATVGDNDVEARVDGGGGGSLSWLTLVLLFGVAVSTRWLVSRWRYWG